MLAGLVLDGPTYAGAATARDRDILRESVLSLRSAAFEWECDGENFVFTTYGYGHGVVIGQMQCNVNNIDPVNSGGKDMFPVLIWLDPSYNK